MKRVRIIIDRYVSDHRSLKDEIRAIDKRIGRWHKSQGSLSLETDYQTIQAVYR